MAKSEKIELAEVLSFERKLSNSDATLYSGNWSDRDKPESWHPINIMEKSVRGTISNRQKSTTANDPLKLNSAIENANLQTVDVAQLPVEHDTLKMSFTLRVLGNLHVPSTCNKQEYQRALEKVIMGYVEVHGCRELAKRYAANIANGRCLWRNRIGVEEIMVKVTQIEKGNIIQTWEFDANAFSLRNFDTSSDALDAFSQALGEGFLNNAVPFFKIDTYARIGGGQEVFPSQELILDKDNTKGGKSKTLYHINGVAGLHSQKVGNALRTVDTWYDESETYGPIAAEPFGSVTSRGQAFRQPKAKQDFYTLFDQWILKGNEPELEQQHYVMSVIIRGGVFGGKD